jgi:TetR/AcrR family transcriptional regulator
VATERRRKRVARTSTSARGARAGDAPARGPGRPPGKSGDATRERILAAAVETFGRLGLDGTSVRDVARQARLRVSSLYHYFPSKEALYREVQERWQEDVRAIVMAVLSKGYDLPRTTREMVGSIFDFFLANRAVAQLSCRIGLEGGGFLDANSRWLGLAEGFLKPAEMRGQVKEVDAVPFLLTIDGLVQWHMVHDEFYRSMLGKGLEDPTVAQRVREHVIQVALRTLGLD